MTVTVEEIDITEEDEFVAVCRKGKTKQRILLSETAIAFTAPRRHHAMITSVSESGSVVA